MDLTVNPSKASLSSENQGVWAPQPGMFWGSPILCNSLLLHCKEKAMKITFHSKKKNITDILVLQRFPQIYRASVLLIKRSAKIRQSLMQCFSRSGSLSTAKGPQCFYIPQLSTGHPSWPPAWSQLPCLNQSPQHGCVYVCVREREIDSQATCTLHVTWAGPSWTLHSPLISSTWHLVGRHSGIVINWANE